AGGAEPEPGRGRHQLVAVGGPAGRSGQHRDGVHRQVPGRRDHDDPRMMPRTLVLLRHGESQWNLENLFTGWYDAAPSAQGENPAVEAGGLMADRGVLPDVLHTSVQVRAIRTAELALREMGRSWIPVHRHWRLNERHYGDLQGLNKAETAERF